MGVVSLGLESRELSRHKCQGCSCCAVCVLLRNLAHTEANSTKGEGPHHPRVCTVCCCLCHPCRAEGLGETAHHL